MTDDPQNSPQRNLELTTPETYTAGHELNMHEFRTHTVACIPIRSYISFKFSVYHCCVE